MSLVVSSPDADTGLHATWLLADELRKAVGIGM